MKKLYILALLFLTGFATSCESYLDVKPEGTLVDGVMFDDPQGFRDAVYGGYASMAFTDLYGENLSYGFTDKIGQLFMYNNPMNSDQYIVKYDYLNNEVRPTVDRIFSSAYTVISYFNNIIRHCEEGKVKSSDMPLIEGEAYAARAFLHFDILRLFSPRYQKGAKQPGIPYAMTFDLNNKEMMNADDAYAHILSDLDKAEKLLEGDNTIQYSQKQGEDLNFLSQRYAHLNKFAVMALKARVYYTMSDMENAAKYARMVIESKDNFHLCKSSDYAATYKYPSPHELIFGLNTTALNQRINDLFLVAPGAGAGNFTQGRDDLEKLYEVKDFTATNADQRFSIYYRITNGAARFTRFMKDQSDMQNHPVTGISLIRLPEMYYILSEALYDTNKEESLKFLNEVRHSRGLEDVKAEKVANKQDYQQEMLRERMRELAGEGQVFFSLKMYNQPFKSVIGGQTIAPSESIFVLPLPENEKEFGTKQ